MVEYNPMSFKAGLAAALCTRPPTRTPVAYLYNGVRLPALPEWDREACIGKMMKGINVGSYRLYLSDIEAKVDALGQITDCQGQQYTYNEETMEWVYDGEFEYVPAESSGANIFWGNHNIVYAPEVYDGATFVESTDPVPVYE